MREQNRSQWMKVGTVKAPSTTLTPRKLINGKQYTSLGGFHDNVALSLRMSVISIGPSGALGTSEI
jgi:hypothetical protein